METFPGDIGQRSKEAIIIWLTTVYLTLMDFCWKKTNRYLKTKANSFFD
jgi:hypothetical protein